jgi:hypothetical protein
LPLRNSSCQAALIFSNGDERQKYNSHFSKTQKIFNLLIPVNILRKKFQSESTVSANSLYLKIHFIKETNVVIKKLKNKYHT